MIVLLTRQKKRRKRRVRMTCLRYISYLPWGFIINKIICRSPIQHVQKSKQRELAELFWQSSLLRINTEKPLKPLKLRTRTPSFSFWLNSMIEKRLENFIVSIYWKLTGTTFANYSYKNINIGKWTFWVFWKIIFSSFDIKININEFCFCMEKYPKCDFICG